MHRRCYSANDYIFVVQALGAYGSFLIGKHTNTGQRLYIVTTYHVFRR